MPVTVKHWEFPPLILHPFLRSAGSAPVDNDSNCLLRAGSERFRHETECKLLEGRYSEVRMLCYLGRDLFRWIGQCSEIVERTPELIARGVREQSFAKMLIRSSPPQMIQKLCEWGVADHAAIFARAMGLNMVFREIPAPDILHDGFLQNYHHYADYLFNCYLRLKTYAEIDPDEFRFEMYASGEYARMLEEQWGGV